jgi:ABC-type oligopeptide transport system substrate-binding subunit
MKKLLTLGLSLLAVVAVLSLSACGQQDRRRTADSTTTTEQPTQQSGEGGNATPTPATPEGGTQTQSGAEGGGQ